jgi:hypothetical protein
MQKPKVNAAFAGDAIIEYGSVNLSVAIAVEDGLVTPVIRDVNADSAMTAYKTMYMDHGSPVTAVKYDRPMKPETIDYLIARIKAKYGGVTNAWNPLVFDQGADPILSAGLDQLDFRNIQAGGELRICAAAGVSPILIGLRSADGGDYESAMRQLADMQMRPRWRSACASLQKLVTVPRDSQLWFDTSDIAALQAAETEKAQVTQVSAAAMLTFIQAGMTPESTITAVTSAAHASEIDFGITLKPATAVVTAAEAERIHVALESINSQAFDVSLIASRVVSSTSLNRQPNSSDMPNPVFLVPNYGH